MLRNIQNLNWKIFWLSCLAIFALMCLRYLGIQASHLLSPLPFRQDAIKKVVIKLHEKPNSFRLRTPLAFIGTAQAAGEYDNASAYIVMDYDTGKILMEKNSDKELPIASLTKIMTSVVALDLVKPTDLITVSHDAPLVEPTVIGLTEGEKISLHDLLEGMLLASGNDAARATRDGIDSIYHQKVFVRAMNEKAKFLNLSHSHFENPQGFDSDWNYSSASDLAILSQYAMTNYPLISAIAKIDYDKIPASATHKSFSLNNWNGLLDVYPGVFGLKIGNTDMAGSTMVVAANRNGKSVLVVILGAPDIVSRDLWTSKLLDLGFAKLAQLPPVDVTRQELQEKYNSWSY